MGECPVEVETVDDETPARLAVQTRMYSVFHDVGQLRGASGELVIEGITLGRDFEYHGEVIQ